MEVTFTPQFKRKFKKLDPQLQKEAIARIKQFEQNSKNPELHTHYLKGKLKGVHSFSVNYKIRILFEYLSKEEVALLTIGSHDMYK